MSEENRKKGILSWVLGEEEEEGTAVYSSEEIGGRREIEEPREPHGFTIERADDIIQNLPDDVPRQSAVRIVRQTLAAAGINIDDLRKSSTRRESKLNSEIKLSQERIRELKDKTDEHVSALEQQIRKAREDRDSGVSKEERKISGARSGIEKVNRVRDFFGLSKEEEQPPAQKDQPVGADNRRSSPSVGEETQVMNPVQANEETQVIRRRRGPLSEERDSRSGRESRGTRGESSRRSRDTRGKRDQE